MSAEKAEARIDLSLVEEPQSPERTGLKLVKTVVISGPSYAGKDLLTEVLHHRHGWPVEDGKGRFQRRTGLETGHMQRSPETHRRFDLFQAKTFRTATPESSVLWQTRLGGIILAEERDRRSRDIRKNRWQMQLGKDPAKLVEIPAVSVLLWARKDVRVERAYNQKMAAWEKQQAQLATGAQIPEEEILSKPTKAEIMARMEERERGDVLDWAPLHPKFVRVGENPFSRTLTREHGGPVYDIVIDTSDLTIDEVADRFEHEVARFGAFREASALKNPTSDDSKVSSLDLGEPITYTPSTDSGLFRASPAVLE